MIDHIVTFVIVALLAWWVLADQMGWNHRSCCRCCCKDVFESLERHDCDCGCEDSRRDE